MKTLEELKQFYEESLVQSLEPLEQKRKTIVRNVLLFTVLPASLGILLSVIFQNTLFIFILVSASVIAYAVIYFTAISKYKQEFKSDIVGRVIKFVEPGISYNPGWCIQEPVFRSSGIFLARPDRYHGEDMVSGKIGSTPIIFSELHAEHKTESTDSNGHRKTHWHTIFKGIFFIAEFNKNFNGKTVVLPDLAEKLFGNLGQALQSLNFMRGQLVKLEDPEFEKRFAVYGDDQVEARYILSTSLMKRIVDFKEKTKKQIYLSFVDNKVFVAMSYPKNIFEPRVFKTIMEFGPIREYFEDLELAIGIVEDLNLNTRIWGRV